MTQDNTERLNILSNSINADILAAVKKVSVKLMQQQNMENVEKMQMTKNNEKIMQVLT